MNIGSRLPPCRLAGCPLGNEGHWSEFFMGRIPFISPKQTPSVVWHLNFHVLASSRDLEYVTYRLFFVHLYKCCFACLIGHFASASEVTACRRYTNLLLLLSVVCLYVCLVIVVSQALLQPQNPDIQAKLLAMQRQMQLSGVAIPTDNAATPAAAGRSSLMLDVPYSAAALRHGRVMTAEQKEEQTRWVDAVSYLLISNLGANVFFTCYFLSILLFSVHSWFYSKRLRHRMTFYLLMCH